MSHAGLAGAPGAPDRADNSSRTKGAPGAPGHHHFGSLPDDQDKIMCVCIVDVLAADLSRPSCAAC